MNISYSFSVYPPRRTNKSYLSLFDPFIGKTIPSVVSIFKKNYTELKNPMEYLGDRSVQDKDGSGNAVCKIYLTFFDACVFAAGVPVQCITLRMQFSYKQFIKIMYIYD